MKSCRNFALVATLMLSVALFCGCKANNQSSSQNAQPGQATPSAPPPSSATPSTAPGQAGAPAPEASAPGQAAAPSGQPAPAAQAAPPPPPAAIELASGTHLRVRLDSDLGSNISHPGDTFTATVADPVVVDGTTVIPRGARAEGTVVDAKPLGRFKGGAQLTVRLERVHTRWGSYPVATSSIDNAEKGKGKRTAVIAGGGAALGGLIGGLAGGGKGAAIGLLAGGGAGTAGSAFTGNKPILLPAETLLTFRLEHRVHITEEARPQPGLQQR
ncbi:MAG TPA: hypothetical protein VL967_06285 [Terracidiphilus sp.]|nr:hypothetical protein [Terracidiphilus sp.]